MAYSERLAQVLGEPDGILAGVSGNKAALRVARMGGELSNTTILDIKKGTYGRIESVRTLAHAYADEILARFKDEIEQTYGVDDARSEADWLQLAEDWLCYLADPSSHRNPRPTGSTEGEAEVGLTEQATVRLARRLAQELKELNPSLIVNSAFSDKFILYTRGHDPASIARELEVDVQEIENAIAGIVPSRETIFRLCGLLDLSPVQASDLLRSAGISDWSPDSALIQEFNFVSRITNRITAIAVASIPVPQERELLSPKGVFSIGRDWYSRASDAFAFETWTTDPDDEIYLFYENVIALIVEAVSKTRYKTIFIMYFLSIPNITVVENASLDHRQKLLRRIRHRLDELVNPVTVNLPAPAPSDLGGFLKWVARNRTPEEIAHIAKIDLHIVNQMYEGVPHSKKALLAFLRAVEAHPISVRQALCLADFEAWDPFYAYDRGVERILRRRGLRAIPSDAIFEFESIQLDWTPDQVDALLEQVDKYIGGYKADTDEWGSAFPLPKRVTDMEISELQALIRSTVEDALRGLLPSANQGASPD